MRRVHGINDTPVAVRDNIDSEYDNVKTVADNIEDVKSVAEAIDGLNIIDEIVAGDNVEVDSTDAARPVVSVPVVGGIDTVSEGTGISRDNTDPRNYIRETLRININYLWQGEIPELASGKIDRIKMRNIIRQKINE